MTGIAGQLYNSLRSVYSVKYIALNIAIAAIYYIIFQYLVQVQSGIFPVLNVPSFMLYLLVITASMLLTVSIRNLAAHLSTARLNTSAGVLSGVTTVACSMVAGCGCQAPFLFSLTTLGLSSASIVALIDTLSANATLIIAVLIAINIVSLVYYLNKLQSPRKKRA